MASYRLTATDVVVRTGDGVCIPSDPANTDYAYYLRWVASGNTPDPYVAPPPSAADINAVRDARLAAGFVDAVTGKTWQCDALSQGKWTAIGAAAGLAMVMAVDPPPTFEMIAADNSVVTLSAPDAFSLINGRVMPWVSATMLYARAMKNQIGGETPPEDITIGWP